MRYGAIETYGNHKLKQVLLAGAKDDGKEPDHRERKISEDLKSIASQI